MVKVVPQSPAYPMQLMPDIYQFPPDGGARRGPCPKAFVIDSVRGYRLVEGAPPPGLLR